MEQLEAEKQKLYEVTFKYRRVRRSKYEKWKQRYKWRTDAHLVVCENEYEISHLLERHLAKTCKDNDRREVDITNLFLIKEPIKSTIKRREDSESISG
ncbi:hypothetical protein [Desulfogranum marinum]|uniref:hypothetical protein n=1 Tax=Desulfogranum marinum TaxID=453220 RepID=UPI0019630841|nr:hypothetical protein [Desulfogranum marinum]MBM9514695.1 hypothetical protein [Desulfogranum marinum]